MRGTERVPSPAPLFPGRCGVSPPEGVAGDGTAAPAQGKAFPSMTLGTRTINLAVQLSVLIPPNAKSIDSHMANLDSIFHGLADPTRRAVIARLARGPAPVSELAGPHDMALPSFLKHLKVLEHGGWIQSDKRGRVRTCRLRPEAAAVAEGWLGQQRAMWEARLDRLDSFLANLTEEEPCDET